MGNNSSDQVLCKKNLKNLYKVAYEVIHGGGAYIIDGGGVGEKNKKLDFQHKLANIMQNCRE